MFDKLNNFIVRKYIEKTEYAKMDNVDKNAKMEDKWAIIERERISFGLHVILSELEKIILLILVFLAAGRIVELLVAMLVLWCIKIFAGGIHLEKDWQCVSVTFAYFFIVVIVSEYVAIPYIILIIIHILTLALLIKHTPINSKLRKVNDKHKRNILKTKVVISFVVICFLEVLVMKYRDIISFTVTMLMVEHLVYEAGVSFSK